MSLQTVTFRWSTKHGQCYECGLPAAFKRSYGRPFDRLVTDDEKLCAVCAANAAADGEDIERIEQEQE